MLQARKSYSTASVVTAVVVLALAGCGDDKDDIVPQSDTQGAQTEEQATPATSAVPTDDPEFQKKLQEARELKEREAKNPNSMTVCLAKDGTVLGVIGHTRKAGAPNLTKADKDRDCGYAEKNASGGPVPPPGQE
jgi:hypothetical protein